jgi:putative transposase
MPPCEPGFASMPRNIRGAGSDRRITMPALKAGQSIMRRRTVFGARNGFGCRSIAGANAAAAPPRPAYRLPMPPTGCGRVDFQFDVTTDGRPVKIVSIIDEHTRESLGGMVERSITGEHLIAELDRLAAKRGTFPDVLRCDNGPELVCGAMADWARGHVGLHFIPPSEPWRNGYVESFNSRVRDECLNINSFWSLDQARVVSATGNTTTTTTAGTRRWATNRRPATRPSVPTNEGLSSAVEQFRQSRHHLCGNLQFEVTKMSVGNGSH